MGTSDHTTQAIKQHNPITIIRKSNPTNSKTNTGKNKHTFNHTPPTIKHHKSKANTGKTQPTQSNNPSNQTTQANKHSPLEKRTHPITQPKQTNIDWICDHLWRLRLDILTNLLTWHVFAHQKLTEKIEGCREQACCQ